MHLVHSAGRLGADVQKNVFIFLQMLIPDPELGTFFVQHTARIPILYAKTNLYFESFEHSYFESHT